MSQIPPQIVTVRVCKRSLDGILECQGLLGVVMLGMCQFCGGWTDGKP